VRTSICDRLLGKFPVASRQVVQSRIRRLPNFFRKVIRLFCSIGQKNPRNTSLTPPARIIRTSDIDLLVFAIIPWEFRTQRPQQLARNLGSGRRVFYFSPFQTSHSKIEEVAPNVFEVIFAQEASLYEGVASASAQTNWLDHFLRFLETHNVSSMANVLVQHPWWWQYVRHFPTRFRVWSDVMDAYEEFGKNPSDTRLWQTELIGASEKVFVSSANLEKEVGEKSIVVRNGCHYGPLSSPTSPNPQWLLEVLGAHHCAVPVGYIGAIEEWFDVEAMEFAANSLGNVCFHIAGSIGTDVSRLVKLPNVHFYGEVNNSEVPGFLSALKVGIIPFALSPLTLAVNPVKAYEYLAAGLPVVASNLPELNHFENLVEMYDDKTSFANLLRQALTDSDDEVLVDRRRSFAKQNSWFSRAREMEKFLRFTEVSVTVIIVHYGDPSMVVPLLAKLRSHPADYQMGIQIFVVNNSPEFREDLELLQETFKCEILNPGENLGFAKGINYALQSVDSEYVVISNNDVIASPGSVYQLCNHLAVHPDVALVGPLTNSIGNEANVSVSRSEGLGGKKVTEGEQVSFGYRGQAFDIRVSALFFSAVRTHDLRRIGGVPEQFELGYFEDDALSAIFRNEGRKVRVLEDCFVWHLGGASFSALGESERSRIFEQNRERFESEYGVWIPHEYRYSRPAPTFTQVLRAENVD